jgi:hypothetical protein
MHPFCRISTPPDSCLVSHRVSGMRRWAVMLHKPTVAVPAAISVTVLFVQGVAGKVASCDGRRFWALHLWHLHQLDYRYNWPVLACCDACSVEFALQQQCQAACHAGMLLAVGRHPAVLFPDSQQLSARPSGWPPGCFVCWSRSGSILTAAMYVSWILSKAVGSSTEREDMPGN